MKKFILWAINFSLKQEWVSTQDIEILLKQITKIIESVRTDVVVAVYPDWVKSHLTQNLETGKSVGVSNPRLVLHPKQTSRGSIDGHEIYAWLIETNQLPLCIELADLLWWEQHSNEIPKKFRGKFVYAWKSVVLNDNGNRFVPYLCCDVGGLFVSWYNLDDDWSDDEITCLCAS